MPWSKRKRDRSKTNSRGPRRNAPEMPRTARAAPERPPAPGASPPKQLDLFRFPIPLPAGAVRRSSTQAAIARAGDAFVY